MQCQPLVCMHAIQFIQFNFSAHHMHTYSSFPPPSPLSADIPLHAMPSLLTWFAETLLPRTLQLLRDAFFEGQDMQCSVHDAFVVKYSAADGQRHLPLHSDESTHSITVALNSDSDFTGGGTYFQDLRGAVRPPIGHVLAFDGNLLHAGDVLMTGTRYIIAAFLLLAPAGEEVEPQWVDVGREEEEKKEKEKEEEGGRRGEEKGECSDAGTFSFSFA